MCACDNFILDYNYCTVIPTYNIDLTYIYLGDSHRASCQNIGGAILIYTPRYQGLLVFTNSSRSVTTRHPHSQTNYRLSSVIPNFNIRGHCIMLRIYIMHLFSFN